MNKLVAFIFLCCLLTGLTSCDEARLFDENKTIENNAWYYKNVVPFDVQIKDTSALYNILVNLRVSADYKYSNMFMMVHSVYPDKTKEARRIEIRLADESGKWLGSGLGDLYDYQFPAYKKIKFPQPGFYHFELEQNMRDDTLMHVKAAGVRIEEVLQ